MTPPFERAWSGNRLSPEITPELRLDRGWGFKKGGLDRLAFGRQ
jgi:hypothetical protein